MTTLGAYSLDFDAAYAARKYDQQNRGNRFDQNRDASGSNPREPSREDLLRSCENQFIKERSKSGDRNNGIRYKESIGDNPVPRSHVPVPQSSF